MIRESFNEQLKGLQDDLMKMADLVDGAIGSAVQSLIDRDTVLAQKVINDDEELNKAQREIEERCLVLLATQQPLASDLRVILATSGIAYELERMADHAKGIAELTLRLAPQPHLKPLIDIPRMAEKGRWLLRQQLEAFLAHDEKRARALAREDDFMDALYDQIYRELLVFMMEDPRTITRATYLMWVSHNLERIGDRTTNIGERVVFMVGGEVVELNPHTRPEERDG